MVDLQQLIDPLGAVCVMGGTILATLARSGWSDCMGTVRQAARLLRPKFDFLQERAKLAKAVEAVRHDGILRGDIGRVTDKEFCEATAALVRHRSTGAMIDEHNRHRLLREKRRKSALEVLEQSAELAPVLGLAGTLLALSQLNNAGLAGDLAVAGSVSLAVVSTLYGLLLAHGLLYPLAAAIERRGSREEEQREELVDWLVLQLEPACPTERCLGQVAA